MLFGLLLYTVLHTRSTADRGTSAIGGRYSTIPQASGLMYKSSIMSCRPLQTNYAMLTAVA
jgi:hypothetical protein